MRDLGSGERKGRMETREMTGETVEMNLGAQSDLDAAEMEVQEEMEMRDAEEVKETKAWEDREAGTSEEPEQEPGEN